MKYELTDLAKQVIGTGTLVFRIKSLIQIRDIPPGTIGGYIEGEHNLSQEGDCWVGNEATVYDNAVVKDNAQVWSYATVSGNAVVKDNANISGSALVCHNTVVKDNATVNGTSWVEGSAVIKDNAHVCGNSRVFGNVVVGGKKLILTGEYGENEYFIDFMTKGPAA